MLIPDVRFKEFNDEWQKINLSDVFVYFSTNSFSRSDLTDTGVVMNIHYGDIHKKFNSILDFEKYELPYLKTDIKLKNPIYCQDGDIIFADASEDYSGVGKAIELSNIGDQKVISGLHTIHARDQRNVFFPGFKGYLFNAPVVHNQARLLANGFKVFGISKRMINELKIYVPSQKEQKKISEFLLLIDRRIELQREKISILNKYKKSLESKIIVGTDSNKLELGKCFDVYGGTSLEKFANNYDSHKFISIGNYSPSGEYIDNGQRVELNDKTKEKLLNKGDLAMVLNDKTPEGRIIGSTILIDENNKYIYNQRSQRLVCKCDILTPEYAKFYLNSKEFRSKIFKISQGGTQIYVNFPSVEKIIITIPKSFNNICLIGKINTLLVKQLKLENNKYASLINLRQGLMQQMFV